ncbi:unnamed protein product, partial [Strongylus vulgaris]
EFIDQCSETFCDVGTLTGGLQRTVLTVLTCNANAQWIDGQSTSYTVAQCEIPCNLCSTLTRTGMTCPTGFTCTTVSTRNTGQCPESFCEVGDMTAGTGRTAVTSLSCNGNQQWVDSQSNAYTVAQCEIPCTNCDTLTNTGMTCPMGFLCEAPVRSEGQCSETRCNEGTLTGNLARVPLTVLTCDVNAQWIDGQSTTYTVAQCEISCVGCTPLTNQGMTCPIGFRCTQVLTRNTGQCPESYCDTGAMTAGAGRTSVTSLSCNGDQQWVDSQSTAYSVAQCETWKKENIAGFLK